MPPAFLSLGIVLLALNLIGHIRGWTWPGYAAVMFVGYVVVSIILIPVREWHRNRSK